jgi:uncharacterized repeat protein (TIGR02543 family)
VKRGLLPVVALVVLLLGATSAGARLTATRTVTVEVIGKGTVKSSPSGISCGGGSTKCYAAFADGTAVVLSAKPDGGWTDGDWEDDCAGSGTTASDCDLGSSGDALATANFNPKSGTTQSTLSVTYTDDGTPVSGDEGDVTSPGGEVDCGNLSGGTDCTWVVPTGSTLTVFQTPAAGSVFQGWGGQCSGKQVSCTVEMGSDRQIGAAWAPAAGSTAQLTVSITGSGKVSGGSINCPSTCVSNEALNSAVTLNASPSDGYIFSGWTGGCTGTSPTCTLTMSADTSVTATFAQANVLSVAINGQGSVTGGSGAINCGGGADICSANFAIGATVSLVATPATGATFVGWTGACGGSATTCTVSMSQSRSVTATFSGGAGGGSGFTLSVSVTGNGTVTGGGINCGAGATTCTSPNHPANSTVTLTATPASGATFSGWGGGTCTGTFSTCTVTFNASKTVTATFAGGTTTFPLTVSVSGAGRVTGNSISCGNGASTCSATFPAGTTITLTATAASGARFSGWGGSCSGTSTNCTVSLTAARTVSATFTGAAAPGTLTINVTGRGSVATSAGACASIGPAKTCVQRFKSGAQVVLTARPGVGQSFLGWSGACTGKAVTCRLRLTQGQLATAAFTNRPVKTATLSSLGPAIVVRTSTGYSVTLRFVTTVGGTARVRALRAGRVVTSVSARVAAGRVRVGPFPVPLRGFYTFETRLAGALLKTRACLGRCGRAAPPPPFLLVREPPTVTRTGDVWSVTLHVRANQIYDGRARALRARRLLGNTHFLGRAGRAALGPFLLGPGNYTLRLVGVDAYGRTRTLTWIVSLGR